ncbi:MAG: low molecular weight phosphotyrosine protein phosphatase [Oscillospiraceae bacterium]|nr:low molecular weight phosphotyrosine protein phosphatase [Oscillospiraceae bacterium]
MRRILFICHGNICRSTMAEFVMKHLVRQRGAEGEFYIDSAATSTEELGNGVHPGSRRKLAQMGIPCGEHRARQLRRDEYDRFDLFIGMDSANLRNMQRMLGGDPEGKIHGLLEYAGRSGQSIADPWYTGNFDETFDDVMDGCTGLLEHLAREKGK